MKYRIGDTFSVPKPACYKFRIREIEQLPHWDGPQYTLQLYTKLPCRQEYGWMDRTHDSHYSDEQIEYFGLTLVSRGDFTQMEMF